MYVCMCVCVCDDDPRLYTAKCRYNGYLSETYTIKGC